jgi:hypothetical protein
MQIKILDTGYATSDRTGSTLSASLRAGYNGTSSVNAFTFNVTSIVMNAGANVMKEDELKTSEILSDVTPVTFQNPSYVLSCQLPKDDIPTTGFSTNWWVQARRLERTKSIKVLYVSTTTDRVGNKTVLEYFGAVNTAGVFSTDIGNTSTPYLVGYVKGVGNLTDAAERNVWQFTLTFEESR